MAEGGGVGVGGGVEGPRIFGKEKVRDRLVVRVRGDLQKSEVDTRKLTIGE